MQTLKAKANNWMGILRKRVWFCTHPAHISWAGSGRRGFSSWVFICSSYIFNLHEHIFTIQQSFFFLLPCLVFQLTFYVLSYKPWGHLDFISFLSASHAIFEKTHSLQHIKVWLHVPVRDDLFLVELEFFYRIHYSEVWGSLTSYVSPHTNVKEQNW